MIGGILVAATLFVGLIGLVRMRRLAILSPYLVLLVSSTIVAVAFPVVSVISDVRSWRSLGYLSDWAVRAVQLDSLAFLSGLVLVSFWRGAAASLGAVAQPADVAEFHRRDTFVSGALIALGLILYSQVLANVSLAGLMNYENFAAKNRAVEGLGVFVFGIYGVVMGCFWAEAGLVSRRYRRIARAIAFGVMLWSIGVLGQRSYAVLVGLGYLSIWARQRGWSAARIRPDLLAGGLVIWLLLELFAISRGLFIVSWSLAFVEAWTGFWRGEFTSVILGGSELTGPFVTAVELRHAYEAGMIEWYNPLAALQTLVPLAFYPDRPATLAQWFAAIFYPAVAARGGAAAFSIVGEAWLVGGTVLGPLVYGAVLGSLALWLERAIALRPTSMLSRFAPFLVFPALIAQRSATEALLKMTLFSWGLVLFVSFLRWLFQPRATGSAGPRSHSYRRCL